MNMQNYTPKNQELTLFLPKKDPTVQNNILKSKTNDQFLI